MLLSFDKFFNILYCRKSATSFFIEVKKSVSKSETKGKLKKKDTGKPVDESKFENYFEFKSNSQFIKHHQVSNGHSQINGKNTFGIFLCYKIRNFATKKNIAGIIIVQI